MQLFGVLVLLVTLSAACGLKCYLCVSNDSNACKNTITCPATLDRCFSTKVNGVTAKGCQISSLCVSSMGCCEGDLCNSAITTGSSVLLLLLSSAITAVSL